MNFFWTYKNDNYYQKHKEKCQKETHGRYQNLSEEKKEKELQYHLECNKNISEEQTVEKVEYMRNYYLANKK